MVRIMHFSKTHCVAMVNGRTQFVTQEELAELKGFSIEKTERGY